MGTIQNGGSALRRFVQQAKTPAGPVEESCEFCSAAIPPQHRHLLEIRAHEIMCACHSCSLLFDKQEASLGRYRLIGDRRLWLENFKLSDIQWESLRLPVDMAFFFHSTAAERVVAYYPSPMGPPTESLLKLSAWEEIVQDNAVLEEMVPDVEALLVNRAKGARQYFIVPIDECYRLVSLLRLHWRGFSGGQEVWQEIGRFFENLRAKAKPRLCDSSPSLLKQPATRPNDSKSPVILIRASHLS